ncbi:MAG: hypothetical protein LBD07_03470, partial [Spirochaetaceae bacterium]|nr:hypothetical protein [Spirochaetaceae bacterium]
MNVLVKKYEESALTRSGDCGGGGRRFLAFPAAMRRAALTALAAVCIVTGCEQVTSSEPPSSNEAEETGPLTEGFDFNTTPSNSSNTVFDMDNSTWADEGEPPIKN